MSDVRIERVEACSHDIAKGHRIAGEMLWCDGEDRKVLDGFPPEAVEAAAPIVRELIESVGRRPLSGWLSPRDLDFDGSVDAAVWSIAILAAVWDALLRSDSE